MTFLQRHFRLYNRRYFGNRLPTRTKVRWAVWLKRRGFLGLCYSCSRRILIEAGLRRYKKHALLVLLHEMIHLKLRHQVRHMHGPRFQREVGRLARLGALKDLF